MVARPHLGEGLTLAKLLFLPHWSVCLVISLPSATGSVYKRIAAHTRERTTSDILAWRFGQVVPRQAMSRKFQECYMLTALVQRP